jgi:hypothetical protein
MNQKKPKVEIEATDLDGGFTVVDGQKMRIILDSRGLFKGTVPAGTSMPEPSSLDEASTRARTQVPVAKTLDKPAGEKGTPPEGGGPQGGAFRVPG